MQLEAFRTLYFYTYNGSDFVIAKLHTYSTFLELSFNIGTPNKGYDFIDASKIMQIDVKYSKLTHFIDLQGMSQTG